MPHEPEDDGKMTTFTVVMESQHHKYEIEHKIPRDCNLTDLQEIGKLLVECLNVLVRLPLDNN